MRSLKRMAFLAAMLGLVASCGGDKPKPLGMPVITAGPTTASPTPSPEPTPLKVPSTLEEIKAAVLEWMCHYNGEPLVLFKLLGTGARGLDTGVGRVGPVSCKALRILGRAEAAEEEEYGSKLDVDMIRTQHWWYVEALGRTPSRGWLSAYFRERRNAGIWQLGYQQVLQIPVVEPAALNPGRTFDLVMTKVKTSSSSPCYKDAKGSYVPETAFLRNAGPGTGPKAFEIRVDYVGGSTPPLRTTVRLLRGLEPGEEIRILRGRRGTQVRVDPGNKIRESDEGNNAVTLAASKTGGSCITVQR